MENEPLWWLTKDGDKDCLAMYERHYSAYAYQDGRKRTQFVGPGEKVVLRTERADAVFVWRKFIDDSGQTGINCAVFRNESSHRSSHLIRQADSIADCLWPNSRHYTYINAERIASKNPGFCFLKAGWRRCGKTKGGLIIMERSALDETAWLIEMASGPPAYWSAVPDPRALGGFDPDVNKATRFARKKDAEEMALFLHVKGAHAFVNIHEVRIAEHVWTAGSQASGRDDDA